MDDKEKAVIEAEARRDVAERGQHGGFGGTGGFGPRRKGLRALTGEYPAHPC